MGDRFEILAEFQNCHFDTCDIYKGRLYINNQHEDNVIVFDLETCKELGPIVDSEFSFPHGLAISPKGVMAVTNYGTSTVVLRDL